jgi:hypothetical protein
MLPKKLKLKNEQSWDSAKVRPLKQFFNLNFFESILSLRSIGIFQIGEWIFLYELFQEKNCSPLRRAIFLIFGHKTPIKEEIAHNKEICFCLMFLELLSVSIFKKVQNHSILVQRFALLLGNVAVLL